jgi:hypothetical protein
MSSRRRSKSRSKIKSKPKIRSRSRSKPKIRSLKRSKSRSPLKPVCSMRVQFYSDIKHSLPYFQDSIKNDKQISRHIGQRKLFLTELYFLAEYAHLSNLIVYVGASPGNHINLLADLFPKHIFHLYDNREYSIENKYIQSGQIVLFKQYFTNENVEEYKYKNILFISDIRNRDTSEFNIINDMIIQKNWITEIKPIKSLVKFRLPYGDQEYCNEKLLKSNNCIMEYLNGKLLLQPWSPVISTEMRLIVDQYPSLKNYDCIEVEEKCFYHNYVTRNQPIRMSTFNKKTGKSVSKNYTWDYMQECAIIRFFKIKYPIHKNLDLSELLNKHLYHK